MTEAPLCKIQALFAQARKQAIIISAFVGSEALDALLQAADKARERIVYARWDWQDIASGASDWRAWDVARRHKAAMYACPALHAKAYIGDNEALIGSANATTPGLAGSPQGNLELLVAKSANATEVEEVLRQVREIAFLAPPLGEDVAHQQAPTHGEQDDGRAVAQTVWLPKSAPDRFLQAMAGTVSHNDDTEQDRIGLRLGEASSGRGAIRNAVRDATVFRVVRSEFESRVRPMSVLDVQELLARQASPAIQHLSRASMVRLCQWLGEFGENAFITPTNDPSSAQLVPGKLLSSTRLT